LSEISDVLAKEPQNAKALGLRAQALMQKHQNSKALEAALNAVMTFPPKTATP
jgi:hypothetical protein